LVSGEEIPEWVQEDFLADIRELGLASLLSEEHLWWNGSKRYLRTEDALRVLNTLYGEKVIQHALEDFPEETSEETFLPFSVLLAQMQLFDVNPGRILSELDTDTCLPGGTCWVYRAKDYSGQDIAIKAYKPEMEEEAMVSAWKEQQAAKVLLENPSDDPRIVRCLSMTESPSQGLSFRTPDGAIRHLDGETAKEYYGYQTGGTEQRKLLTMRWIEGKELHRFLKITKAFQQLRQAAIKPRELLELVQQYEVFFGAETMPALISLLDRHEALREDQLEKVEMFLTLAIVQLVAQAAEVLEIFHNSGLCHADIKPESFKVNDQGVCLFDLGNTMKRFSRDAVPFSMMSANTFCPELFEEAIFMEEISGTQTSEWIVPESYKPHHDVFSLAATLYFLLTGKAGNYGDREVKNDVPGCPKLLADIIEAAMGDPSFSSFPTASSFQFALELCGALQQENPGKAVNEILKKRISQPLSADEQERIAKHAFSIHHHEDLKKEADTLQKRLLNSCDEDELFQVLQRLDFILLTFRESAHSIEPSASLTQPDTNWLMDFSDEDKDRVRETVQTYLDHGMPVPIHAQENITDVKNAEVKGVLRTVFVLRGGISIWWDDEADEWRDVESEDQARVHRTSRPTRTLKRLDFNLKLEDDSEESFDPDDLGF